MSIVESGIYAWKCTDCDQQYLGQTESSFRTGFKEYHCHINNKTKIQNFLYIFKIVAILSDL